MKPGAVGRALRDLVMPVAAGIVLFLVNNFLLAGTLTRLPGGTLLAVTDLAAVALVVLARPRFGSVTLIYGTYGALGILGHVGTDALTYALGLPSILLAAFVYDAVIALGRYSWPGIVLGFLPFATLVSLTRPSSPSLPLFAAAVALGYAGLALGALLRRTWTSRTPRQRIWPVVAFLLLNASCSVLAPEQNLADLVLQDSTYLEPGTMAPFTGNVFKYFPDLDKKIQLEGHMKDGLWNGEITVYHPNGRIRYMGELADGVKCGVWTENQDPNPPKSLYKELKQEIEAMGLYPPCPEG